MVTQINGRSVQAMLWFQNRFFVVGVIFMLGIGLAAQALHWFITPMAHPGASTFQAAMVGLQFVVGASLTLGAALVARRMTGDAHGRSAS
jgi:hypothetical protein